MRIKIITDSSSDIPKDVLDNKNIREVPLQIIFSDGEYYDKVELSSKKFFEKLQVCSDIPTTSQVTPAQFMEAYEQELKDYDMVLCITLSSAASGTYQSACIAAQEFGDKVKVFDSESFCNGTALLVLKASEMVELGMNIDEIIKKLEAYRNRLEVVFSVDTLKYLKKGGRIKSHEAFIGELLNIKPILAVENGLTVPVTKERGRKGVLKFFKNHLSSKPPVKGEVVVISHGQCMDYADNLIEAIGPSVENNPQVLCEVGATIGTHAGPGVLSVAYIREITSQA